MSYFFSGDIEFSEVDNFFSVHQLGLSPSGDAAIFEIERHKFPDRFEPFKKRIELGTTTPDGNLISEELKLFPSNLQWGVRIEIKRSKSQFIQGNDGTYFWFIVGTWIDYDHNHNGKPKILESKFMGLLRSTETAEPIVSDKDAMEINSRFRTRR